MTENTRLGFLTPSSNTVMEPVCADILRQSDRSTAHFARFQVTQIAMDVAALNQFDFRPQLTAAEQLADAKMHAIAWGGTSGSWIGLDNDKRLCRDIMSLTGVPSTTSTLATFDAFKALGVQSYGLVTPYLHEVQSAIVKEWGRYGLTCVAEEHLNDRGNYSFCQYGEDQIADMTRRVAAKKPDAIAILCTNFFGSAIAPALEVEIGIPVIDSITVTVWRLMQLAGANPGEITGWGQIMQLPAPTHSTS